ncbi:hypothetical protein LTR53_012712 [Teratosphaeriaceae sp. CCFEE 6253]|nr:hypothetical protein LTR53_012712 [Teratosphaeriaceae sp. CCFEE 6253]
MQSEDSSAGATTPAQSPQARPIGFFNLPRELRDIIYSLALIPEVPIEFAGLAPSQAHEEFWGEVEDYGQWWYEQRYKLEIAPSLQLLRSSKQVCEEATPIYYGQPFRFTNQAGWITLNNWLRRIGSRKSGLLRHITIYHPALSTYPTCRYDAYTCAHGDLLERFGLKPSWPCDSEAETHEGIVELVGKPPDPAKILTAMPGLRSLHLVLQACVSDDVWEMPIASDPIYTSMASTCPNTRVLLIHLSHYRPEGRHALFEIAASDLGPDPEPAVMNPREVAIRRTLGELRKIGIEVVEQHYDQHRNYPVRADEPCKSPGMCEYMWRHTWAFSESPFTRGLPRDKLLDCQGTVVHQVAYSIRA